MRLSKMVILEIADSEKLTNHFYTVSRKALVKKYKVDHLKTQNFISYFDPLCIHKEYYK